MAIIELAGMPRAGKTSLLGVLSQHIDNAILHLERFDLIPFSHEEVFEYNYWYAKHCVTELLKASSEDMVHLFDRGILDRIAFGRAIVAHGSMTQGQLAKYLSVLEPYSNRRDLTFILNVPAEISLENAKGDASNITRDLRFLRYLNEAYDELAKKYKKLYYLPTDIEVKKLAKIIEEVLKDRQILTSYNTGYTEN